MNAVLYQTSCEEWDPFAGEELYDPGTYLGMKLNQHKRVAIFVTRRRGAGPLDLCPAGGECYLGSAYDALGSDHRPPLHQQFGQRAV